MRTILITMAACLILAGTAQARMYQWMNPASGTMQLSGTAPSWYRSMDDGPRVFVFDNGELVDDTDVEVNESQRLQLRADAFGHAGGGLTKENEVESEADELRAALEKAAGVGVDVDAVTSGFAEQQAAASTTEDAVSDITDKAAALKSLIDAWDQRQLEQARSLIELLPQETRPPPAAAR